MKNAFLYILLIITLNSCTQDDEDSNEVLIRISNVSNKEFKNIIINTSTGNVSFEDLNAGKKSNYQEFEVAYNYAFVEVEIDGTAQRIPPIDYVGETPLKNSKYTYEIDVDNRNISYASITLKLIED